MDIAERITVVNNLQKTSSDVVRSVFQSFKTGMSEYEIAEIIREEFAKKGVQGFWYDVPIIVLIGTERLINGANADYATKSPSKEYVLKDGSTIYIDVHPEDAETSLWGDWNTMAIFHPRAEIDDEQVAFLEEMREIHREGIAKLKPTMTGADIMNWYFDLYQKRGITPLQGQKPDVGHTIHEGLKINAKRMLINAENTTLIGGHIYAIEPAGFRPKKSREGMVVGRFEECVYIPKDGNTILLGSKELVDLTI